MAYFSQPVCSTRKSQQMLTETKNCLSCSKHIHGRTDKKFCSDHCRNAHNNRLNSDGNCYVRNINHRLRRNRRILENLLPAARDIARLRQQHLHSKGFAFHYFTHTRVNKKGNMYHFCYEYGWQILAGGMVLIVRKKERVEY